MIVKFCSGTYRGPSEQTQLNPAHRKSKDKHSCQPPATLFKYLSASWLWLHTCTSKGWLMTNSVIVHAGMWACMLTMGAVVKCPFSAFENLNILTLDMPICNKPPERILQTSFLLNFCFKLSTLQPFNLQPYNIFYFIVFYQFLYYANRWSHKLWMNPFYLHSGDSCECCHFVGQKHQLYCLKF